MIRRLTVLALAAALGLSLALVPAAPAQDPPVTPSQADPTTPDTLPQDEDPDDEELGEEIPEDQRDDEGQDTEEPGTDTPGGGGEPPSSQRATPAEPSAGRLPRTGADSLPRLAAGMLLLGLGLLLWSTLPSRARRDWSERSP